MRFYKSWDVNGALSNFSPHPVDAPAVWGESQGAIVEWPTVEHFYQAQKFSGVDDVTATEAMEAIRAASSPEEAARIGRTLQRTRPSLIRRDWDACKEGGDARGALRQADSTRSAEESAAGIEGCGADGAGGLADGCRVGCGAGR